MGAERCSFTLLLADISDTVLGMLSEVVVPFNRHVAKTFVALLL